MKAFLTVPSLLCAAARLRRMLRRRMMEVVVHKLAAAGGWVPLEPEKENPRQVELFNIQWMNA